MFRFLAVIFTAGLCFAADPAQVGAYGYLRHVAYAPNGQSIAIATARAVEIWDAGLGRLLQTYPLEPMATRMRLAWSYDSRSIALSTQGRIMVWEGGVGTSAKEMRFQGSRNIPALIFPQSPPSAEWSPQGDRLAFLAVAEIISQGIVILERDSPLWRLPPALRDLNRPLLQPKIQRGGQYEIAWSPDGSQLAGITDRTVELWDAASGAQLRVINLPAYDAVSGRRQERWPLVAWSPAGAKLATCDRLNFVQVWDAATGGLLMKLDGGNSSHSKLAWSRKGDRLALATAEAVTVWDATSGAVILNTQNGVVGDFASFSPDLDGGVIATLAGQLEIWPPLNNQKSNRQGTATGAPHYAAWLPGDKLAVWEDSGNVRVFDGSRRVTLATQAAVWGRQSIAWSSSGELLVPDRDGAIALYIDKASIGGMAPPPLSGPPGYLSLEKLTGAKPPIYAVAFTPGRNTQVAALGGGSLWIWDRTRHDPAPQRFPISGTELAWTSDHTILIAGFDGSVTEFDLAAGKSVWAFSPPNQPYPKPARLSPDGRYFSANQTMWRRNDKGPPEISVPSLAGTPYWTADGKAFAMVPELRFGSDLALRESSTGNLVVSLAFQRRVLGTMSSLVWSPDGLSLALATMDGSVYVQRLRLQAKD